ncbi:cox cluster protein [Halococcus morrhuae DSM 1307]|uniref:Cox cluster protein n=1 Tax=Halococcus morrhuae DSM 1307 TaxID=931277 RepID=M0M425_HALMO|nr:DUF6684 family protein [Halococcus morrhuae]EMA39379.1 cox cluster protein [Halococcus morrhuae DSM 1307]
MSERTFDRETLLDLTVNIVPLGILTFFILVFLFASPWELDPFVTAISIGLLVVPFAVLVLVTFVSGRAVAQDEQSAATAGELSASDATLDSGVEEEPVSDDHPESDAENDESNDTERDDAGGDEDDEN